MILTAIFNPVGIAGANRQTWDRLKVKLAAALGRPRARTRPSRLLHRRATTTGPGDRARRDRPGSAPHRHVRTPDSEVAPADERTVGDLRRSARRQRVDIEIQAGEIVGLIGPNGAGKTSFVDALTGFTASAGTIEFMGAALEDAPPHDRLDAAWPEHGKPATCSMICRFARTCGSLPSRPRHGRWSWTSSGRAVPMTTTTSTGRSTSSDFEQHADDKPTSLSLGQQKLLGVARALAARPHVVLLDEPAAGLDSTESRGLGERLHDIVEHGISVFLIDHDMGLVLETCDYIYVLEFGTLIAEGTPAEIRSNDAVIEAYLGNAGQRGAKTPTTPRWCWTR